MLPSFIVVGPQRTGTTWLYEAIKSHVCMPSGIKETMFFDRYYLNGLKWYEAHFDHYQSGQVVGEIAPTYFHSCEAAERIFTHIPHCKIICTLREPVARTYSLYRHMRAYGETKLPFEEALKTHPCLLESSRYYLHIQRWQKMFGTLNVLVLINDDLVAYPQSYVDKVAEHIGLNPFKLSQEQHKPIGSEIMARNYEFVHIVNTVGDWMRKHRLYRIIELAKGFGLKRWVFEGGQKIAPMSKETEDYLRKHFYPEIEHLEQLLGRNLSQWKGRI